MDEHNKDFEEYLRQFTLREAGPLPEVASPERNWLTWFVPGRHWALAAAGVALVAALSFMAYRNASKQNAPDVATAIDGSKPGEQTDDVPAPGKTPRGAAPRQAASNQAYESKGQGAFQRIAVREGLTIADDLGGSERVLTHITTDKPIYRGGETVYVRAVLLRAEGHTPVPDSAGTTAHIEIRAPKGEVTMTGGSPVIDSTAAFSWTIPDGQAGGEYRIRITHPLTGDAPAQRKFDIRAYRAPRLKSQIVFLRDGYGPADTVTANLHVERAEGGVPAGARVDVSARVDGDEVWRGATTVDASGNASASFKLPAKILRGDGVIAMAVNDGGAAETASKTIPILLQTVDLEIYPEGGDLVAGLLNRVYIEGRTPNGKPADAAGLVVNSAGRQVATFRTEHEGRGRFSFTPVKGESYALRLTEPAGIKTTVPLPQVKDAGVVIASTTDVTPRQRDVTIRIAATREGVYDVVLAQRGKEIAFKSVALNARQPVDVTLTAPRSLDGVAAVTVYDANGTPLAERLVFRQPDRALKVQVTADRKTYVPGDKVTLRVNTTDQAGKPAGAVVGLTVTDSSVLEMIDKREQAPRLPVMVYLENDVWDLADAHVYMDDSNPKAARATDLLLGTQGWRRFATAAPSTFVGANGDAARRALAIRIPPPPVLRISQAPSPVSVVGTITGTVQHVSDAFLPGVAVRLVNEDTGVSQTTLTTDAGQYVFIAPPATSYSITVASPGFKQSTISRIVLRASDAIQVDVRMEVGNVSQTVVVDATRDKKFEPPTNLITLDETQIMGLPLVGTDPLALITTLPGYRASPLGHEFDTIGGLPMSMINTVRDGLSVTDGFSPVGVGANTIMNPDAISETRLVLAPVDAEAGRGVSATQGLERRILRADRERLAAAPIRRYAHIRRPGWTEGSRSDFQETIFWSAGLRTDATTGEATVSFDLSDAITSFRVLADGFASNGALGSSVESIESVRPFFIEPKMPLQVTSGDVVRLPVSLVNVMSHASGAAELTLKAKDGLMVTLPVNNGAALNASERARRLVQIDVASNFSGLSDLVLEGKAGPYTDSVIRRLDVQPRGFPYAVSKGGVLEPKSTQSMEFALPEGTMRSSVSSSVVIYPTPLASMTQALQALVREPYGCFEQTSTTSYPMVMAQQYFLTHSGVEPTIIETAKGFLERAYNRLIGFEARSGGFEWFGHDPGHEALTAYGLMQFTEMSQVRSVDPAMLQRTRSWLLERRDGKGGFKQNGIVSHSFGGAPEATANAYITWTLVESGEKALEREIAAVRASANSSEDSYIIALAANVLHAAGDRASAQRMMDRLASVQDAAGNVRGAQTSITRSGGQALAIETTALSVLAWMREPAYAGNVQKGMRWLVESNKDGRFASTQATVLALRAIVAYDAAYAKPKAPGRLSLSIDGESIGAPIAFSTESKGAIVMPSIPSDLAPGKHTLTLKMDDGSDLPFSMLVRYNTDRPDNSDRAQVDVKVSLRNSQVREGAITEAMVSIANKSAEAIPTPVAIVGIPGGLEVRHDQLKELVKSGRIAAYEVIGREIILYWRYLKAKEKLDFPLSLVAAVPGTYTGPASRAYLYYTDEYKTWSPGLTVTILD